MADIKILDDSYESDLTEAESTELLLMCGHAIAPPLSPAAQGVLDAAKEAYWLWDQMCPAEAEDIAAAALRAAAKTIEDLYCDSDMDDSPGVVFAMRQLMLIADELEQQPIQPDCPST